MFRSTKTYGHDLGLSTCFRQWKAKHSHCQYLHGYAISVKLEFQATRLDERNWVQDFGGLKDVKTWLQDLFDHTTIVAHDDPELDFFKRLRDQHVVDLRILPAVGCEYFAFHIFEYVEAWLKDAQIAQRWALDPAPGMDEQRVHLLSVEVREHGANSAIFSETPRIQVRQEITHGDSFLGAQIAEAIKTSTTPANHHPV